MQKLVQHSNRLPNRNGMLTITEAENAENNYKWSADNEQREGYRMGDSKYGIKPSFILTVDESFTLLRDQYHITRHLFDFLSGPYFQNFESMKGEQSGHLREEARREARTRESPLIIETRRRPRRGPRGWGAVCLHRDLVESVFDTGIIAHPPSFGISLFLN